MQRWRRLLVQVVALACVPVLVFTAEGTAQAATSFGSVVSASYRATPGGFAASLGTEDDVNCSLSAWWAVPESPALPHVQGKWKCSTGWDVSQADTIWTLKGTDCGAVPITADVGDVDGTSAGTVDFLTVLTQQEAQGCFINQWCYDIQVKQHWNPFATVPYTGCVDLNLGTAPGGDNGATCPYFTPQEPVTAGLLTGNYGSRLRVMAPITYSVDFTNNTTQPLGRLQVYAVLSTTGGHGYTGATTGGGLAGGMTGSVSHGTPAGSILYGNGSGTYLTTPLQGGSDPGSVTYNFDVSTTALTNGVQPSADATVIGYGIAYPTNTSESHYNKLPQEDPRRHDRRHGPGQL